MKKETESPIIDGETGNGLKALFRDPRIDELQTTIAGMNQQLATYRIKIYELNKLDKEQKQRIRDLQATVNGLVDRCARYENVIDFIIDHV